MMMVLQPEGLGTGEGPSRAAAAGAANTWNRREDWDRDLLLDPAWGLAAQWS